MELLHDPTFNFIVAMCTEDRGRRPGNKVTQRHRNCKAVEMIRYLPYACMRCLGFVVCFAQPDG